MSSVLNEMLIQPQSLGEIWFAARDITGPTSYATGGQVITPQLFAMTSFKVVECPQSTADGTYYGRVTSTLGTTFGTSTATQAKLKWYVVATGAEVANATNLSAEKLRCIAWS